MFISIFLKVSLIPMDIYNFILPCYEKGFAERIVIELCSSLKDFSVSTPYHIANDPRLAEVFPHCPLVAYKRPRPAHCTE